MKRITKHFKDCDLLEAYVKIHQILGIPPDLINLLKNPKEAWGKGKAYKVKLFKTKQGLKARIGKEIKV